MATLKDETVAGIIAALLQLPIASVLVQSYITIYRVATLHGQVSLRTVLRLQFATHNLSHEAFYMHMHTIRHTNTLPYISLHMRNRGITMNELSHE